MTQLTDNLFAVEVPDDAQDFLIKPRFDKDKEAGVLIWFDHRGASSFEVLPNPYFDFLFTTKDVTEEQAASIVQIMSNGKISGRPQYRRYDRDLLKDTPAKCWTRDSRHSLGTLLTSKNLNPKKNYALLKRNEDG